MTTRRLPSLALALALAAPGASAQTVDAEREADALARTGIAARREGRDADALASFQRAVALSPRASLRAQVGFALQALGRWVEAERELDAVVRARDPWTDRHRATVDAALGEVRSRLGWLAVTVEPAGCELRVEGEPVPSGEPIRRPAGAVTVSASCPDHYPAERAAEVRAGETSRETLTLRRRTPEPPPAPVAPPPVPPVLAPLRAPSLETPPTPSLPWAGAGALAGVGVAAIGVGVGLWVARGGALDAVTASGCVETPTEYVCDARVANVTAARAAHDEASTLGAAGVALLAVGSGLVVGGAVWLVAAAVRRPSAARPLTFAPGGLRWDF